MAMSLVKYCPKSKCGLTLIEVLIALSIIGIAMTAVIKATSQNIQSTGYLQNKTIAMWVGQLVMNEIRGDLLHIDSGTRNQKLTTDMLGRDWYWQMQEEETPIKRIKKITVSVFANDNPDENEDSPLITLESFRYDKEQ